MERLRNGWIFGVVAGMALCGGPVHAQATKSSKSLEACQKTAQTETAKYATAVQKRLGDCLEKIASVVVAGNQSSVDVSAATKICLAKLYDLGRSDGKSLGDKLTAKINKSCGPLNANDILGTGSPDVNQPLDAATRIGGYCANFASAAGTLAEWIDCLRAAADCQARQQITVDFPRAPEWLRLMDTQFTASSDNKKAAAQAALEAAHNAMDTDGDDKPDIACGLRQPPLATGQTDSFGSGSDGALQKGAAHSFTDNGDGTITDNITGLMWEKKDSSTGIHYYGNTYTWGLTASPYTMNGTMVSGFLATLNAGAGFAGHTDWRVPNINELQTTANYARGADEIFGVPCPPGCTVTTCSCNWNSGYWTSTTAQSAKGLALVLNFWDLESYISSKNTGYPVRAVRGGSLDEGCLESGGTVTTGMCCASTSDFPSTCVSGACGCSPAGSHQVRVCNCPSGTCFNGTRCVSS